MSSTWVNVHTIATGLFGFLLVFAWSFCEGVIWPFVAELPLVVLLVTIGRSPIGIALITMSALGSLVGVTVSWTLVHNNIHVPMFFTHQRMIEAAKAGLKRGPARAFKEHMFNGVPVKVYAYQAGLMNIPLGKILLSAWPRVARIFIVGSLGWGLGLIASGLFKSYLGWAMIIGACLYLFILRLVVRSWR